MQPIVQDFEQIVQTLSHGIIILDRDLRVLFWNRWMEQHTQIKADRTVGKLLTDLYPGIENKALRWKVESVFSLGNFSFFSQRLHRFLIPMPIHKFLDTGIEHMQQNVIVSPLRGDDGRVDRVAVSIIDNTDAVIARQRLEETTRRLEEMSRIDPLTGIANRRHLFEQLGAELHRNRRLGGTVSLAMLDLDRFKEVNDEYGHLCGDCVLIRTAEILEKNLRPYDVIGRYGGEEFCVILPRTTIEEAAEVMDRIRKIVDEYGFTNGDAVLHRTVSIGIASVGRIDRCGTDELIRMADEALYAAKRSGRNRVEVFRAQDALIKHVP